MVAKCGLAMFNGGNGGTISCTYFNLIATISVVAFCELLSTVESTCLRDVSLLQAAATHARAVLKEK